MRFPYVGRGPTLQSESPGLMPSRRSRHHRIRLQVCGVAWARNQRPNPSWVVGFHTLKDRQRRLGLQLGTSLFNLSPSLGVSPRHARGAAWRCSLMFLEIPYDFTFNPMGCARRSKFEYRHATIHTEDYSDDDCRPFCFS